jgi:hypothetical protein
MEKGDVMKSQQNRTIVYILAVIVLMLVVVIIFFLPSLGGFSSRDTTRWVASRYVFGQVAAMETSQADALLKQQVEILPTEIRWQGKTCTGLVTRAETFNTQDYLAGTWQTSPQALGIQQSELQVISTNCDIPGFQEYLLFGGGQLVIGLDGVFFVFDPQ